MENNSKKTKKIVLITSGKALTNPVKMNESYTRNNDLLGIISKFVQNKINVLGIIYNGEDYKAIVENDEITVVIKDGANDGINYNTEM